MKLRYSLPLWLVGSVLTLLWPTRALAHTQSGEAAELLDQVGDGDDRRGLDVGVSQAF